MGRGPSLGWGTAHVFPLRTLSRHTLAPPQQLFWPKATSASKLSHGAAVAPALGDDEAAETAEAEEAVERSALATSLFTLALVLAHVLALPFLLLVPRRWEVRPFPTSYLLPPTMVLPTSYLRPSTSYHGTSSSSSPAAPPLLPTSYLLPAAAKCVTTRAPLSGRWSWRRRCAIAS